MRIRWRTGTSSGMVALKAGPRKAEVRPQTAQKEATAGKLGPNTQVTAAMAMPFAARMESQIMMIALRLCLSAMTPPKGESNPMGRKAST